MRSTLGGLTPSSSSVGKRSVLARSITAGAGEPLSLDYLTEMVRGYVDAADIGKRGAWACSATAWRFVSCRRSIAPRIRQNWSATSTS
jgi:hypothetical protein